MNWKISASAEQVEMFTSTGAGKNTGYPMRPIAHTRDPETAHAAADKVTKNGQRKSNNQRVAWLVARYPGKTASELTSKAASEWEDFNWNGFDKSLIEVRRRLSDMSGVHVRRGEKHEARIGLLGNKESVWYPL